MEEKTSTVSPTPKSSVTGGVEGVATKQERPLRKIVIETDGNSAFVTEAQVAGNFELIAILEALLEKAKEHK